MTSSASMNFEDFRKIEIVLWLAYMFGFSITGYIKKIKMENEVLLQALPTPQVVLAVTSDGIVSFG